MDCDLVLHLVALHQRPGSLRSWTTASPRDDQLPLDLEIRGERVAGRVGHARRLEDAAEVGVAAVQRGLDQGEFATARATGSTTSIATAHDDPTDALGALAVGDDLERERAQQRVHASPNLSSASVSGSISPRTRRRRA